MIVEIIQKNTIEINSEAVRELLCLAFEGGSSYWYVNLDKGRAATEDLSTDENWSWIYTLPTCGGSVTLQVDDSGAMVYTLDDKAIKNGLEAMAAKFPARLQGHFFQADYDSDAEDGDVFLQCCLFGDVIYG